jgi:glutaredoxin 3
MIAHYKLICLNQAKYNMKKVTVYSTPSCHFCHMAKDFFNEHQIPFEDFNVVENLEKRQEMMDKSGQMGVPVIIIDGTLIVGFNKPKIAELLDIKE